MPGHKRRYNVRFPPSRIKKMMQKDSEVGRIAMAVPVIICILLKLQDQPATSSSVGNVPEVSADQNLPDNSVKAQHRRLCRSHVSTPISPPPQRNRRHELSVKKTAEVVEKAPRSSLDSLDNESSSSVRVFFIVLHRHKSTDYLHF
ncbi:hypothetical protein L3Q82_026247 [Scortum barcoo]|uniref:Uncharacterized protein n=1 Tax=Scortum barcoo TaxID=214431 RepID=A0ACB8WI56_9TELE|nr:hypothetical protein L3Q82_026247 [Scortum barcoo]